MIIALLLRLVGPLIRLLIKAILIVSGLALLYFLSTGNREVIGNAIAILFCLWCVGYFAMRSTRNNL